MLIVFLLNFQGDSIWPLQVVAALAVEPGQHVAVETDGDPLLGGGIDQLGVLPEPWIVGGVVGVGGDGSGELGLADRVDRDPVGLALGRAIGAVGLLEQDPAASGQDTPGWLARRCWRMRP